MQHYASYMRTTVDLEDHLLAQAKELAARTRTSLTRVLEESLRAYLAEQHRMNQPRPVQALPVLRNAKPVKRVNLDDTSALLDLT
jgi:hypothetical protein